MYDKENIVVENRNSEKEILLSLTNVCWEKCYFQKSNIQNEIFTLTCQYRVKNNNNNIVLGNQDFKNECRIQF